MSRPSTGGGASRSRRAPRSGVRVRHSPEARSHIEGEFLSDACRRESWGFGWRTEMIEDLAYYDSVADQRDPFASSAAVSALEHVDGKDAFEQLGPRCALGARFTRRSGRDRRVDRGRFAGASRTCAPISLLTSER